MKIISFEKLSKKKQKELNKKKRSDWNGVKPTIRIIPNKKKIDKEIIIDE